jgi:fluoroacetyl-CoA thioesterase
MKKTLTIGMRATFSKLVTPDMTVEFEGRPLHEFCSTYWLSHLAELVSRIILEPCLADDEDGFGTGLSIRHYSPAAVGQTINLTAVCSDVRGNYSKCSVEARVGQRLVSTAEVHQVIVHKSQIEKMHADRRDEMNQKESN